VFYFNTEPRLKGRRTAGCVCMRQVWDATRQTVVFLGRLRSDRFTTTSSYSRISTATVRRSRSPVTWPSTCAASWRRPRWHSTPYLSEFSTSQSPSTPETQSGSTSQPSTTYVVTCPVSRRRRDMYCGHPRLCDCLSAAAFLHYWTDPDV